MSSSVMEAKQQEWFRVCEVRRVLQCSEKRVRRLFGQHELSGDKNGPDGSRRISRQSLVTYMERNQIPPDNLALAAEAGQPGAGKSTAA